MNEENNKLGFKAYDPGLVCRGYQYEEGKTYAKGGHGICCHGVTHYCVNPFDVLDYYPLVRDDGKFSDFTTVEALEEPVTDDGKKFATGTIKIGVKLGFDGFIKACVNFLYEKTTKDMPKSKVDTGDNAQIGSSGYSAKIGSSGDNAQIGSSGYYAQIGSSGYYAKIGSSGGSAKIGSSGHYAQIGSSGDNAQIGSSGYSAKIGSSGDAAQIGSSGDNAKIGSSGYSAKIGSSGHYAQIGSSGDAAQIGSSGDNAKIGSSGYSAKIGSSGDDARIDISGTDGVCVAVGVYSKIKSALGNWITLAEWAYDGSKKRFVPVCVRSAKVDGEIIKPNTWYMLKNGEFVECNEE